MSLAAAEIEPDRPGRCRSGVLRFAPVLLPLVILMGTDLWGLDFGLHWDERPWQIGPTKHMVQAKTLLPGYYDYPSFDYWLNLAVLAPDVLMPREPGEKLGAHLVRVLDSPEYLLRLRAVYLGITSLALAWVYALVLHLRGSRLEALLAATFLACSWEIAYHLRWVASDSMLMQFAALTVLLAMHALNTRRAMWLMCASITAGLGFATKYPGGLLVLPVLTTALLMSSGEPLRTKLFRLTRLAAIFALVFVVVTPAVVLEPQQLVTAVLYQVRHYATGHGGHSIGRGFEHAWRMLNYFSTTLFSSHPAIALLVFALAACGSVRLLVRDWRRGSVLFIFPAAYLLYFSRQGTMIVRNLLVVAPFFAIAAAHGAAWIGAWLAEEQSGDRVNYSDANIAQQTWAALLAIVLGVNVAWLITSARSIVDRNSDRFVREAAAYIREHREEKFLLSPRVQRDLAAVGARPENVVALVAEADRFVLYAREGMRRWHDWPASRRDLTRTWFGPREVNFNIYPNWWGDDRIVVIDRARAAEIGLLIAGVSDDPAAPIERAPELPASRESAKHNTSPDQLPSSWALPSIDPRLLVNAVETQSIIGTLARGPVLGSWELDGRGCTFLAADGSVVSVVIISTSAFNLERFDHESLTVPDVAAAAYTGRGGPFGDVRLFARTVDNAVVVHIAGRSKRRIASLAAARQFAEIALARLDAAQRFSAASAPR